jgi:chaperonin cofactor prefoldin
MTYKQIKKLKALNKETEQLSKQYHKLYRQEQRINNKNHKIRHSIYTGGVVHLLRRISGKWSIKREEIRLQLEKEAEDIRKKQANLAHKYKTIMNTRLNFRNKCDHKTKDGEYINKRFIDKGPGNIRIYRCNLCHRRFNIMEE